MRLKTIFLGISILLLFTPLGEADIYRWTDESGNTNITDRYENIPPKYRSQTKVTLETKEESVVKHTVVKFRREGNSILLNVTMNYTLSRIFHLDTGATHTMILEEDAQALGLDWESASTVKSRIADGSVVAFAVVRLNSLQVGEAEVRNIKVLVGQTRLLGLNFLKKFKVTVDSESGNVIFDVPERVMRKESESVRAEKEKAIREFEIKIEKAKLQTAMIEKNMQMMEIQLEELSEKKDEFEDKLLNAVQRNKSQSRIDKYESLIKQYDLAIESRELSRKTYTKDIDILKNNIEFFERQIRQLR